MPVTPTAKRALRKDRTRTLFNLRRKRAAKQAVDAFKQAATAENYNQASSKVDQLAKHNLIHPNKAARIKSQLSRMLQVTSEQPEKKAIKSKRK